MQRNGNDGNREETAGRIIEAACVVRKAGRGNVACKAAEMNEKNHFFA